MYSLKVENNKGTLHLERQLDMNIVILETKYYPALRSFFQTVRSGDEKQIVLLPGASAAQN
jgi:vacuolar-type H+-ATPase subunit F/Vma7